MDLGCTKIVQKAFCFVSVANRGLGPKSRLQKAKARARGLAPLRFGHKITQEVLYAGSCFLSMENWKCFQENTTAVKPLGKCLAYLDLAVPPLELQRLRCWGCWSGANGPRTGKRG